jgi:antitoxin component YwqK of YwqJK toxin-antitoxin module
MKKETLNINLSFIGFCFLISFFLLSCDNTTEKKSNDQSTTETEKPLKGNDFQEFYTNGKLRMEGKLINGKRVGVWKSYYENGNIWSVGVYVNGKRQGTGIVFYNNGKKRMEGDYKNDARSGLWIFYNENGEIIKKEDFNTK